jgi:hypothetical protein
MPKIITIKRRKPAEINSKNKILRSSSNILFWMIGIAFGVLVLGILARMVVQFTTPEPTPILTMEQDIPLPGAFPDQYRTPQNPFAPGLALLYGSAVHRPQWTCTR